MLINRWLLVDHIGQVRSKSERICLQAGPSFNDLPEVIRIVQQLPAGHFSVMMPGEPPHEKADRYIEMLLTLFFHPGYAVANYMPIIFTTANTTPSALMGSLESKARKQGFAGLSVRTVYPGEDQLPDGAFSLRVDRSKPDLAGMIAAWTKFSLSTEAAQEINLLVATTAEDGDALCSKLGNEVERLSGTDRYEVAARLYEQQCAISRYREELKRMANKERDNEYYLGVQMQERSKGMEWYHREYEVLPLWYKRFGHIIKVIMGKRSFRSLFTDDHKKDKV